MVYHYVIVIDQGTHSTRAIIYDQFGSSIFSAQDSIDLKYLDQFRVEQSGEQILKSCQHVFQQAHEYAITNELDNVAVALVTQRSTIIAWDDQTGNAITPALSWMDTRAKDDLQEINLNQAEIKLKTGLPLSAHYGASKLRWMLKNNEEVKQALKQDRLAFGPLAAYLLFNLIKNKPFYVDYSNAHRTLLWNLSSKSWDQKLLDEFHIKKSLLPKPVPNAFSFGEMIDSEYPLVLTNGDQNSAVYGYGKLEPGTIFVNVGTGAFVIVNTRKKLVLDTKLLTTITYSTECDQEHALEGTINGAGSALTWAKETWELENINSIFWKDVNEIPVFINTVGGLGSPWWISNIEPYFLDKTKNYSDYSKQQCTAALIESIIFLIKNNIDEMCKHDVQINQIIVAGGLSRDDELCQRLSNLCKRPVTVSSYKEATSRGAAWQVMHQPDWQVLNKKLFFPNNDTGINSRYMRFKMELERLVS